MEKYKSTGNTGVAAYENTENGIILEFKDGRTYLYDYSKPGKDNVDEMRALAAKGSGLTTYINQNVRENYKKRLR